MKIYDKVRGEKLKHDINRKVAKVSALSSGKIDKYKYLAIHVKKYYLLIRKAFEWLIKTKR